MTFWLRFGLIAFAVLAIFLSGHKLARLQCKAAQADALKAAEAARKVDESFSQGVSAAYENVASQLRRITTTNRVELTREVTKEVYRCPLPAESVRLLNTGIDAANAAAGQPDATLPANPTPDGERPGGASAGIFGTDGELR